MHQTTNTMEKNKRSFFDITPNELFWKHLLPVATAGVIDRALFHPWETVITLKQDSGASAAAICRDYWQNKGIKALYKGYSFNVLAAIPIRVSIFGTYSIITEQGKHTDYSPLAISLAAGFTTGFLETTILCPVDAYRVRKTLEATASEAFHYRFLFKGYGPLLARTSVENSICLLGTDVIMNQLKVDKDNVAYARYGAAFFAGALSQLVSTPFDTIKTRRMKMPDASYSDIMKSLYKESGIQTFFRSAGTKAARSGVCNAMMIGTSALLREAFNEQTPSISQGK